LNAYGVPQVVVCALYPGLRVATLHLHGEFYIRRLPASAKTTVAHLAVNGIVELFNRLIVYLGAHRAPLYINH
jgi:hypothetical protein